MVNFIDIDGLSKKLSSRFDEIEKEVFGALNLVPEHFDNFDDCFQIASYPTINFNKVTEENINNVVTNLIESFKENLIENKVKSVSQLFAIRLDKIEEMRIGFLLFCYAKK